MVAANSLAAPRKSADRSVLRGVGLSTLADALARPTQKHFIPTDVVEPISVLLLYGFATELRTAFELASIVRPTLAAVILFLKSVITLGELMKSIDLMYQTMLFVQTGTLKSSVLSRPLADLFSAMRLHVGRLLDRPRVAEADAASFRST
ncbi:hypothetical protein CO670_18075 [Rhizobium sp. J15]|nr:hypothetical protein CO670_18075 [Rhizobium sp. J15]